MTQITDQNLNKAINLAALDSVDDVLEFVTQIANNKAYDILVEAGYGESPDEDAYVDTVDKLFTKIMRAVITNT